MAHYNGPIQMFLELSKRVPISVIPGTTDDEDTLQADIFYLLIPELPRIRSLRLFLSNELLRELNSGIKKWTVPLLESIILELSDEVTPSPPNHPLVFLQNASLPALRTLSLRRFRCTSVQGFLRPTLTTLIVRMPSTVLPVAEWLGVMEELPLLEYLVLDKALKDESLPSPVTRRVEMTHLARVELYDWYIENKCARLLDSLVLPSCHEITLEVRALKLAAAENHSNTFSSVASAMGSQFKPKSCDLVLAPGLVIIQLWQEMTPVLKYAEEICSAEHRSGLQRPQVNVFLTARGDPDPYDALQTLSSALPLSNIRTLRLKNTGCDLGVHSLSTLQAVEDLMYVCTRPLKFLRTISKPEGCDPPPTPSSFPALRHLTLRDAEWHKHGKLCLKPFSDPPLGPFIDAVVDARRAMGVPLQELHLQSVCNLDESQDLEWFKDAPKSVAIFSWDTKRRSRYYPSVPCDRCQRRMCGWTVGSDEESDGDLEW